MALGHMALQGGMHTGKHTRSSQPSTAMQHHGLVWSCGSDTSDQLHQGLGGGSPKVWPVCVLVVSDGPLVEVPFPCHQELRLHITIMSSAARENAVHMLK